MSFWVLLIRSSLSQQPLPPVLLIPFKSSDLPIPSDTFPSEPLAATASSRSSPTSTRWPKVAAHAGGGRRHRPDCRRIAIWLACGPARRRLPPPLLQPHLPQLHLPRPSPSTAFHSPHLPQPSPSTALAIHSPRLPQPPSTALAFSRLLQHSPSTALAFHSPRPNVLRSACGRRWTDHDEAVGGSHGRAFYDAPGAGDGVTDVANGSGAEVIAC